MLFHTYLFISLLKESMIIKSSINCKQLSLIIYYEYFFLSSFAIFQGLKFTLKVKTETNHGKGNAIHNGIY